MVKPIIIKLKFENESEPQEMTGIFEDHEWQKIEAYLEEADKLWNTKFILKVNQGKDPTSLTIRGDSEEGLVFKTKLPPWKDVELLLHRLRPFVLHNEFASFNVVRSIISRRFENQDLRKYLKFLNNQYEGKNLERNFGIAVGIPMGKVNVISESTLRDWLNSEEYHRDQDLKRKMHEIQVVIPPNAFRAIMIMLLTEKARAIFGLARILEPIVDRENPKK